MWSWTMGPRYSQLATRTGAKNARDEGGRLRDEALEGVRGVWVDVAFCGEHQPNAGVASHDWGPLSLPFLALAWCFFLSFPFFASIYTVLRSYLGTNSCEQEAARY